MGNQRFLIGLVAFTLGSSAIAGNEANPFAKSTNVDIKDTEWVVKGKTATKSGSGSGTFYHLFYDKKQLRLRMGEGSEDNASSAKKYDQLAIEDVTIDGKRLPLFQWCLQNQQRHSRFLQQGLSVRKNICINEGSKGSFTMRLNAATVESLKKGSTLSFGLKPYRSSMKVSFDISDFNTVVGKLGNRPTSTAKKTGGAVGKKCEVTAPKGFDIEAVSYTCGDEVAKGKANAMIALVVKEERERRKKKAAARKKENEAKRKELVAKKAREEERMAAEAAALAASAAQQEAIGSEINSKMIAVCKKKWAAGEHRCYCEKYLDQAPAGIKSDPTCK